MQSETQEAALVEDLRLLVELQGIDAEISVIEKQKAKLPILVERAAAELRGSESEASEAQANYDAAEKKKSSVELELQAMADQLLKLKLRTTDIKNNKEYFAHLKEIEDTERKITELEDSSLELMDRIKETSDALAAKNEALATEKAKFDEDKARIEKGFDESGARLEQLLSQRNGIFPKITPPVGQHYDMLVKKFPDSAVVQADRGTCSGCRVMMPPQMYNNVRKGDTVVTCNNCRRILYYIEG